MRIRDASGGGIFEQLALAVAILLVCAQSSFAGVIVEDLPPPCSAGVVPCRVEDPAPPPAPQNRPAAAPVPSASMLPCPLSVPCIATGDSDNNDQEAAAPASAAPGLKSSAPPAGLVMRVTPDNSTGGDYDRSTPRPPDQTAARRAAAPSFAAKAPAARPYRSVEPTASAALASVSLAGTGDLKQRAEQSVSDLGTRLARVDASAFSPDDAQTYLQALDLERAARRALSDRDYLAALDLSRKATDLAGTLSSSRDRLR